MFLLTKTITEIENLQSFVSFLYGLKNGTYEVIVKRLRKRNSDRQRGWLWGAIYPLLLQALINEGWEFTSVDQVHEFFKKLYSQEKFINRHSGEIVELPNSTALMDTVEYATYCEKLREYAKEYLNIDIGEPDPNWKENEKSVKQNG